MKTLFITLIALANVNAASLDQLTEKNGKTGTLTSYYNGKVYEAESNLNCTIKIEDNALYIEAPTYFSINALLDDAKTSERNGKLTITTIESGKRPGGSACGDYGMMTGYKKTIEVKDDSVAVIQEFRCNLIEKNHLKEVCNLK